MLPPGALHGIRVIDLSRMPPGRFCSMLLGDLGADVIAIEEPAACRAPIDADAEQVRAHDALMRNKRSIGLDLKHEDGRRVLHRLVATADVFLEAFRPGVAARLGADYAALTAVNERLVYCSLSGYGQTGPYAQRAGHDLNYIAVAGALGMIGRPGTPPAIPMNLVADLGGGGVMAAFAIAAALVARGRTGRGQQIDLGMSDGALSLLTAAVGRYLGRGELPRPGENRINGGQPFYDVYATRDGGWLAVGPLEPKFFANLCRALDAPQLLELQDRDHAEIRRVLGARFATRTRAEWVEQLAAAECCVTPVYALDEALADEHNRAREMVVEVPHPTLGRVRQIGIAPKLGATPGAIRSLAPRPGEHGAALLAELGLDRGELARLRASGAVV